MKLLVEAIEDFECLTEAAKDGKKTHYIHGIFAQAEKKNRNGRLYPKAVMESAVNKYIEEMVSKNRAVCTFGHEDSPRISENKISHIVTELRFDGNDVYGKAKVLETIHGKELQALIEGKVSFGCSTRGTGNILENQGLKIVQPDFSIASVDAVLNPSGIDCWVSGILEESEWIMVKGEWVRNHLEEAQSRIKKASRKDVEKVALQIWENYINSL